MLCSPPTDERHIQHGPDSDYATKHVPDDATTSDNTPKIANYG
jgi:hypothetical protein